MKIWTVFLWLSFLLCMGMIFFLSFQNGEDAKNLGSRAIRKFAVSYYGENNITDERLTDLTYFIRQRGRILIFFVMGILGTAAIHTSLYKLWWIVRAIISVAILMGISVFTERFKIYLPTRHYSETEMMYSIYSALAGFVFVSAVTLVYSLFKHIITFLSKNK